MKRAFYLYPFSKFLLLIGIFYLLNFSFYYIVPIVCALFFVYIIVVYLANIVQDRNIITNVYKILKSLIAWVFGIPFYSLFILIFGSDISFVYFIKESTYSGMFLSTIVFIPIFLVSDKINDFIESIAR